METPLKNQILIHINNKLIIKISKIGLRHVLSWPKLSLEPKFHDTGTFGGFGKREQSLSRLFYTGPYGTPHP